MLSTSALRNAWAPACNAGSFVRLPLHGAGAITVDRRCVEAFAALNAALRHHDYRTRKADTGAYNCRKITGGKGYSLHAYGIAADLNWNTNGYTTGPIITDMPSAMVADIKAIRTNNGKTVFRWGGDYRSVKDAMHYEVVCTPADLATGIKASTVAGATPATFRGLRPGDKGEGVEFLQSMLNLLASAGLRNGPTGKPGRQIAVDGDYGPATRAAVGEFQTFARAMQGLAGVAPKDLLAIDGIAGPDTLGAIAFWVPFALEHSG